MKERLIEFLAYLGVGQTKFEEKVGLARGLINKISDNVRVSTLDKIAAVYPELNLNWLRTGEGNMIRPGFAILKGKNNVNVSGGTSGITGVMTGGTIVHNDGTDRVIEKQEQQVAHMFEAFMVELRGFHEYILRQDDQIKHQDDHLNEIVKHSYLRNERNMERFDTQFAQQNELIRMVVEQNKRTQDRADRLLDILEKKL